VGTLFLVATPIGNLEDITLRALRVLGEASCIAAEDTRQTRKLLERYQVRVPLISYHEHNKRTRLGDVLARLAQGDVALVSDAGTPGLSDPGYELVGAALKAGYPVQAIPGPSAPIAALVSSGLPTDAFVFLGYLPRRRPERVAALRQAHPEVELWRVLPLAPDCANPGEACIELLAEAREYLAAGAHAIMIDTWTPRGSGGTGETCDWAIASNVVELLEGPVVLAGGITPEIVRHAVRIVQPAGLDISSGVEAAPGIKSPERMRRLFYALRHWDEQRN